MHCGSVQIDCRRCLRAKVSSLSVEIQRGDVVFTAYACEHGAVLNPFGCVVSHTFDCSPCFLRNNAALQVATAMIWLFSAVKPDDPSVRKGKMSHRTGFFLLVHESVQEFRKRPELHQNLRVSFLRMMKFYGLEVDFAEQIKVTRTRYFAAKATIWLSPGNHNHLRITRILRCLSFLGLEAEARAFFECLSEIYDNEQSQPRPRSALRRFSTGGEP